jgi:hypothetical protein
LDCRLHDPRSSASRPPQVTPHFSASGEHIVVANDNNLPYSAGRKPNVQDDNEFILLWVPDLLRAR